MTPIDPSLALSALRSSFRPSALLLAGAAAILSAAPASAPAQAAPKGRDLVVEYSAADGPKVRAASKEFSFEGFRLGEEPLRWQLQFTLDPIAADSVRGTTGALLTATGIDASGRTIQFKISGQGPLLTCEAGGLAPNAPFRLRFLLRSAGPILGSRVPRIAGHEVPLIHTVLGDADAGATLAWDRSLDVAFSLEPAGLGFLGATEAAGARWIEWRGVSSSKGQANGFSVSFFEGHVGRTAMVPEGSFGTPRFARPPAGWRTAKALGGALDEAAVLRELQVLARDLVPYGLTDLQIDDGWQSRAAGEPLAREWTADPNRFPRGLAPLARSAREAGLRTGLWILPHAGPRTTEARPGLLTDAEGKPVDGGWVGPTIWNGGTPEGRAALAEPMARLAAEGIGRFLLDAQPEVIARHAAVDPRKRPGWEPIPDYRASLEALRAAAGPESFLATSWAGGVTPGIDRPPLSGFGILDSFRTGHETEATGTGLLLAAEAVATGSPWNGHGGWSDPDTLFVGGGVTLEEARCWASLVALSGQSFLFGDLPSSLPPDRLEVLRRALPTLPLHTMYAATSLVRPTMVRLWRDTPSGPGLVTALFAWDALEGLVDTIASDPAADPYLAEEKLEFWSGRFLGRAPIGAEDLKLHLDPRSCAVIAMAKARPHPFVLSTSRHVSQGAVDLREERWDAADSVLSGTSDCVAGDPYELRVVLPHRGWSVASVEAAPGARVDVQGRLARARWTAAASGPVRWTLRCVSGEAPSVVAPPPVAGLVASIGPEPSVRLAWSDAGAPSGTFLVQRDGVPIGTSLGGQFVDRDLRFNRTHAYEVLAIDDEGRSGAPASVVAETGQPDSIPIDRLIYTQRRRGVPLPTPNANYAGKPLRIAGTGFPQGLGMCPPMLVDFDLKGAHGVLRARVGIDDQVGKSGSAIVRVLVDDKEAARTRIFRGGEEPVTVRARIPAKASTLTIEVLDAGDGVDSDLVDLVECEVAPPRGKPR